MQTAAECLARAAKLTAAADAATDAIVKRTALSMAADWMSLGAEIALQDARSAGKV